MRAGRASDPGGFTDRRRDRNGDEVIWMPGDVRAHDPAGRVEGQSRFPRPDGWPQAGPVLVGDAHPDGADAGPITIWRESRGIPPPGQRAAAQPRRRNDERLVIDLCRPVLSRSIRSRSRAA
jgi:hypothetical protein